MGLDMYACARAGKIDAVVDFEGTDADEELFYWRKHPNLHGWMEKLYRSKGGTDETFNCAKLLLTSEDLDALERDINGNHLPETSGFFFGSSTPEDKIDDLKFIALAREAISLGKSVYYDSWW